MQIQVNTDHHVDGHEALTRHVTSSLETALHRFSDHITRLEVHLSDENADKSGEHDKRCVLEARFEGRQPVAVTNHAATVEAALTGAIHKLTSLIESHLGRTSHAKGA